MSDLQRSLPARIAVVLSLAFIALLAAPILADKAQQAPKKATAAATAPSWNLPSIQEETGPGRRAPGAAQQDQFGPRTEASGQANVLRSEDRKPREHSMKRARSFDEDLRSLPQTRPVRRERLELEGPVANPTLYVPPGAPAPTTTAEPESVAAPQFTAPAPAATLDFDGLDREFWGAGSPPDPNGDVGPTYYIQTVNTSIGVYDKFTGTRMAAFTFDTFMSQGHFGNLCDTNNFGDPVVLYDAFEDRWVISDFAFEIDGSGNVLSPAYQCFAASKTGDPLSGGWNFYSIYFDTGLNDYPKLGVWTDGIYMSANMFGFGAGSSFQGVKVFALNKAQMYTGAPTVQVVSFDVAGDFTLLPGNARLQSGTPPAGRPNLFVATWNFLNALTVYKFQVNWDRISLSTFTGPSISIAATSWPNASVANIPQPGTTNLLDALQIRAMAQNQYTNMGGVESLWVPHTVRRATTTGAAAPRWYQVTVTGGTVAASIPQAATWDPDGTNDIHRFMPSLALDRAGNMAMGYTASGSALFPSLRYAGRLATDPVNTFSQTERTIFAGSFSQTGSARWGDYSSMTLDPDGCTFWYTNEYANSDQAAAKRWRTRIAAFKYAECTVVGNGMLQGTVTSGGVPVSGATVSLGSRTAVTNGSGYYVFPDLPAGTYPSASATKAGYNTDSATGIVVTEAGVTTQDFSLASAPLAGCLTDTTQADFQRGIPTNCDLTGSPGDVTTINTDTRIDQQQTSTTTSGIGFSTTTWVGQTFVAGMSGALTKLDVRLFCSGCSGTDQPITVEIRTASGNLPTATVLASTTLPGFSSGSSAFYTATFASPATVTAGTQYAYVFRLVTARTGTYAAIFSADAAAYLSGDRVASTTAGATWYVPISGTARDLVFRTYVFQSAAGPRSGTFISSAKDANPAGGMIAKWGTISWNASAPSPSTVQFQAAASNDASGVFTFVGPDGTAATYFANGGSLAQFNGRRYLKYKAILATTDASVGAPTVHDVTVCLGNETITALAVDPATGPYGATATLSARLTAGGTGVAGKTIAFTLNGASAGSAVTNGAGVATIAAASLAGISAGSYPSGVGASFTSDGTYDSASGANTLYVYVSATRGDFNGDGKSDVLWRHATRGEVWEWPMDGAAKTGETLVRTVADTDWEIRGLGDQTGDGKADILWRNKTSGMIYFWPMDGSTPLSETYVDRVDPAYDIVGTGDYNGDGKSDILWRHLTNGEVWIWLMDGASRLTAPVRVDTVDPGYVVKGSGDLNGDTKADIVWHHGTRGDVWVWLMNGTTRTSQTYIGTVGDVGYKIVGVADHTGDGRADILWHHATRGEVWLWPMNGTTVVSESYVGTVSDTGYQIVGNGDYNGDTKADILWHHATRGEVWVWLMNGTTRISQTWVATVPEVGYQIVKVK